ncbi:EamA family transporter [Enterobacter hormaechei]|uniref:EamA family transporter n=1 Tax=Enterobacter hormaechei subsp. steigerwaltii TaxID=299766 RepID=A0AAE4EBX3_9ENTR|nr:MULTISPECIES: EamA family transporter [Enterobacteriaceae]HCM9408888.1 EamA family transporter [Enterobacter hormaechei subsp. xiangfangensis]MCJ4985799.1 EamA family transporter [Klebsiella pneumoniae]MCL8095479.1 EamA family transporter [Enterobacter hormaechei]MCM7335317.1 EamA family transporter [Enterobacter hormaechei]MCM7510256.1 EamA family transporter [Enterobacter hormaechei]
MLSSGSRLGGIAGVLIAAILWGTTGTAATYAPGLSPLAVGAVAMGIGGLLQGLIAAATIVSQRVLISQNWHFLLTGAVAVAIYPLAFYASMHYVGVTVGTVISIGSAPILSALIEYRLDGFRLTRQWMCGAVIGVAGMVLLCLAESSGNSTANGHATTGIFLGLLAGLTYAFYSWSARRLMQAGVASRAAMGVTFGAGGILLMPVLLMTGAPLLSAWNNAAVGIYMALVPMFLGYVCYGYGLARIPASMTTTITLLEPVIAALLAIVLVGEKLPPSGWAGVSLIIACLGIITVPAGKLRLSRFRQRKENFEIAERKEP